MKKILLITGGALLVGAGGYLLSYKGIGASYLNTSVFEMNSEIMEAMTKCPFEESSKCHVFIEECTFIIDSEDREISSTDLQACKLRVEEKAAQKDADANPNNENE